MRGTVCVAAGVAGIMALCAGCGEKTGTTGTGTRTAGAGKQGITVWWAQWAPADGLQQLGSEFEKETGIAVKVHQIPWSSYQDQVFLNFGHKQTDFDIVVGDSQWIGRGAKEGLYVDLSDWLPKVADMSKFSAGVIRYLCEYPGGSGRYFAAPCESDAVGFAYRRDWFEDPAEKTAFKAKYGRELSVPDTWDEFRQVAEFFNRPDKQRHGCAILTGRDYDSLTMGFQQIMWTWGGSWGDEKTFEVKGHADCKASVEAMEFMKDLLSLAPRGAANFDYSKNVEVFENGSVAMSMNYFAFFPGLAGKMGEKAGFFIMPKKGDTRFVSLGGQGMSISAKTSASQQELAKKFIAWFLKTEVQKKWITKPAGFTANTEILNSDEFRKATSYNTAFAESLKYLRDFWNVPVYNELLAVTQQYLGQALDGVKTPQAAMQKIAEEHERIFKDAGLLKKR